MNIDATPRAFRQSVLKYPPHNQDAGIEAAFGQYAGTAEICTSAVYLPIYWTNNYHVQARSERTTQLRALPEVEAYLETLDPGAQYFTVTQGAEGIYERLPDNVFVFSSGGVGDEPLPLLCTPHPRPCCESRDLLASFCGALSPGGPVTSDAPPRASSSDRNGAGTRVRRRMEKVFGPRKDCVILQWLGADPKSIKAYCDLAGRSKFGLTPRGYGKTSFRLYEMFSIGTVPVYIYDDPWLPYKDRLDWSTFCVLCHVSEIKSLPDRLLAVTDEWWHEARRIADELFDDYFTFPGACRQIARMAEERWPL